VNLISTNKDKNIMGKEKEFIRCIPKIYRRNYEDIGMFFFVEAQKQIIPAITVCQAINNYHKFIGVEDFDCNSAIVTLSRMRAELIDFNYENPKKNK
jgi:hypothetical protein